MPLPVRAADILFDVVSSRILETAYLLPSDSYLAIIVAALLASLRGYEHVQTCAQR
jgi:hypothetical protein